MGERGEKERREGGEGRGEGRREEMRGGERGGARGGERGCGSREACEGYWHVGAPRNHIQETAFLGQTVLKMRFLMLGCSCHIRVCSV
eukprot:2189705-Rhodomonas_salina.3